MLHCSATVSGLVRSAGALLDYTTRSDREDARNAHLNQFTHNGKRRDSNRRKQLERGFCVTQLPMRTYVDCWSYAILGVEVSIVATDEP